MESRIGPVFFPSPVAGRSTLSSECLGHFWRAEVGQFWKAPKLQGWYYAVLMDIDHILADLREKRDGLDEAIVALQRMVAGSPRRGRPPKWLSAVREERRPLVTRKRVGSQRST